MKKCFIIVLSFCFLLLSSNNTSASENKFITIVNPVRIAPYTKDVAENLSSQYKVTKDTGLPATWLLTYDVLLNKAAIKEIKKFDENQEIGLFLEVGKSLGNQSDVSISDDSWQFANVIFLTGYAQEERKKLLDTLFGKFKEVFGYYPTSVGSWWTDSYSLSYIQEKYNVTANLTVADQFATDRYQVWGQYWGMPFYPSKYHSGLPAKNINDKIPVVMIQWAPRDPINGYYSSLYSTQDYHIKEVNQDVDFFRKILLLYLSEVGGFGQVTIGLESDLNPDAYNTHYKEWLETASGLVGSDQVKPVTMREFASWYADTFLQISPNYFIRSKDLTGKNKEVVWYQNENYRIGIISDNEKKEVKIIDLRMYPKNFYEPYYIWPNRSFNLSINIPSLYDAVSNINDVLVFENTVISNTSQNQDNYIVELSNGEKLKLYSTKIELINRDNTIAENININQEIKEHHFRGLTPEALSLLQSKKIILTTSAIVIIFLFAFYKIRNNKVRFGILALIVSFSLLFIFKGTTQFSVSQSEVDALRKLNKEPTGKILVYDNTCLYCERYGEVIPAAVANRRSYVEELTDKEIIYNKEFFEEKNIAKAKEIFSGLNVKYIYLVRYGEYMESFHVSPGDINAEKIYSTANAEIWKVKNDQ